MSRALAAGGIDIFSICSVKVSLLQEVLAAIFIEDHRNNAKRVSAELLSETEKSNPRTLSGLRLSGLQT